MNMQRNRLICALAITACMVLAVPAMSVAVESGASADMAAETGIAGIASSLDGASALSDDWKKDPLAALDRIEAHAVASGEPSDSFMAEAGVPSGAYEVRASADGSVVGCVMDADEEASLDAVRKTLSSKSWQGVLLSGVTGATFVKQSGGLRWILVTCTQAGQATCVVYRLVGEV